MTKFSDLLIVSFAVYYLQYVNKLLSKLATKTPSNIPKNPLFSEMSYTAGSVIL